MPLLDLQQHLDSAATILLLPPSSGVHRPEGAKCTPCPEPRDVKVGEGVAEGGIPSRSLLRLDEEGERLVGREALETCDRELCRRIKEAVSAWITV